MFAPKVSKPQTKAEESPTGRLTHHWSTLVGHRLGQVSRIEPRGHNEERVDPASLTARGAPRGGAWDFSRIPLFPHEGASRPQSLSPVALTPLPGTIQAKLVVGPVNDPLEHEADRVANQVMRMPDAAIVARNSPLQISRKCAACEEEEKGKLQRKRAGAVADESEAPSAVHEVLGSPGRPLDAGTRAFFEPRFGVDFSRVRVHDDDRAALSTRQVGARAYAVGNHIVFDAGNFAPAARPDGVCSPTNSRTPYSKGGHPSLRSGRKPRHRKAIYG